MKNDKNPQNFSTTNSGDLPFENELLKLKIQAEFGSSHISVNDLPPEIENFFLKNIINIEHAFANGETISLFDKLGQPTLAKASELDDAAIEIAQLELENLFTKNGIFTTFSKNETPRDKYIFITEKLFKFQVDDLGMPEMMMHFNCVDPNLEDDIED